MNEKNCGLMEQYLEMLLFFFDVRFIKLKLKVIKNDKIKNNLRDVIVVFFLNGKCFFDC